MKKLILLFGMIVLMTSFSRAQTDQTWIGLDGSNDYLDLGTSPILAGKTQFTVDMRIHVDNNAGDYTFIGQRNSDANRTFVMNRYAGLYYILFNDYNYGTCPFVPCPAEVYHLAAVYDGAGATNSERLKFYVNGELQILAFEGTIPGSTIITSPLANLVLGCEHNGAENQLQFFKGQFGEFCVWNYPLTPTEVNNRIVPEVTGNEAGLVEFFHFDNGIADGNNAGIISFAGGKGESTINLKNMTMDGASSNFTGLPELISSIDASVKVVNHVITANATNATYQWLNCDNGYAIIPGETSKSYTATEPGNYSVQITQGSCTVTSECIQIFPVGITPAQSASVSVYPNPAKNQLIIEIKGNKKNLKFEILNSSGQVVYSDNLVEKTYVQTSDYATGIYVLKINTGHEFEIMKFVKE